MSTTINNEVWLLNAEGDANLGDKSFILVLAPNYQSNGTDTIIVNSVRHANDYLQGRVAKDKQNYPFIQYYQEGTDAPHSVVYVTPKNLPAAIIPDIEKWITNILKAANLYTSEKLEGPRYHQKTSYKTTMSSAA